MGCILRFNGKAKGDNHLSKQTNEGINTMKTSSIVMAMALCIGVVGCVDTSGTRVGIDTSTGEATVMENSRSVANKVKIGAVTYGVVDGGEVKRATVTLESTSKKQISLAARMVWMDAEGTEIDADGKPYRSVIIDGYDTYTFTGVAPSLKAVKAKLQVKINE